MLGVFMRKLPSDGILLRRFSSLVHRRVLLGRDFTRFFKGGCSPESLKKDKVLLQWKVLLVNLVNWR